ncbi:MAG: class I SAM-dependent methyltransferase [Smithella sp.]|nr:class I SAM-dependent methyltransferase [Smithella sp.]
MIASSEELAENNRRYLERVELYRELGYDVDEERSFVIEKALPVSGRILEAGTGKGYFSLTLARAGFSFTTCDISAGEQRYARMNLAYYGLDAQVSFEVADLEQLPCKDGSYDVIFAVNLLHHLASLEPAVKEMMRVLSGEGKIILADFNEKGMAVLDKLHAQDGRVHEVGEATIGAAGDFLKQHGFFISIHPGAHQDVLVALRKPGRPFHLS